MIHYTGTYTDHYQLTMAQAYFTKGYASHRAVFDYFFRKNPFEGGYAIFSGLEDLLQALETLCFTEDDIVFLKAQGFSAAFLDYLKSFQFRGNIYASLEGDLVFPTRPVLSVEANIIEAQVVETLILNILNYQTLIATKASRMRRSAGMRQLIDFGLRRAPGPGGYYASRAAYIGGFDATSNVCAGRDYGIPVSGTMSHAFVQSYDDEYQAFLEFSEIWPDACVLLVDTYDTLKSGLPNAIKVAKILETQGRQLKGIRLDSGDLAVLAKAARILFDEAGLNYVSIAASNQLDEYAIQALLEQQAPIDVFGVGTSLVTGEPDSALDGVYKLAFCHQKPRLKLSETKEKITLPCKKQVHRMITEDGSFWGADIVSLHDEVNPIKIHLPCDNQKTVSLKGLKQETVLHPVFKDGQRIHPPTSLKEIRAYSQSRLKQLPVAYHEFEAPRQYQVGLSEGLFEIQKELIKAYRQT